MIKKFKGKFTCWFCKQDLTQVTGSLFGLHYYCKQKCCSFVLSDQNEIVCYSFTCQDEVVQAFSSSYFGGSERTHYGLISDFTNSKTAKFYFQLNPEEGLTPEQAKRLLTKIKNINVFS